MRYYFMLCDHFCYEDSFFELQLILNLESMHADERKRKHVPL
jgi:hypothetical protein